jgi:hypothetical protein
MYDPLHTNDINAAKQLLGLVYPSKGGKKKPSKGVFSLRRRRFEVYQRQRPEAFAKHLLSPANFRAVEAGQAENAKRRARGWNEVAAVKENAARVKPDWELSGPNQRRKDNPAGDVEVAADRLTNTLLLGRMHGGRFVDAFRRGSSLYARDRRLLMGPVFAYVLQNLPSFSNAALKAILELSWHIRTSSAPRFTVAELERLQKSAILCVTHAEAMLPTSFASISTHQLVHLPEQIAEVGCCHVFWLYG